MEVKCCKAISHGLPSRSSSQTTDRGARPLDQATNTSHTVALHDLIEILRRDTDCLTTLLSPYILTKSEQNASRIISRASFWRLEKKSFIYLLLPVSRPSIMIQTPQAHFEAQCTFRSACTRYRTHMTLAPLSRDPWGFLSTWEST